MIAQSALHLIVGQFIFVSYTTFNLFLTYSAYNSMIIIGRILIHDIAQFTMRLVYCLPAVIAILFMTVIIIKFIVPNMLALGIALCAVAVGAVDMLALGIALCTVAVGAVDMLADSAAIFTFTVFIAGMFACIIAKTTFAVYICMFFSGEIIAIRTVYLME